VYVNRWPDYLSRVFGLFGVSLERAWLSVILQLVVATSLGLPVIGRLSGTAPAPITHLLLIDSLLRLDFGTFMDALRHLILPAFALSLGALAQIARVTRSRMLEERTREYVRANLAQGLRPRVIIYKYMMRNAFPVVLTIIGLSYGTLLGNAFLVETVFGWPGIGQYGVQAIANNDLPAIAGVTLVLGIGFVVINTVVDILYAYIDPRVRATT
jgi:peptide/nickel transport system permease protein